MTGEIKTVLGFMSGTSLDGVDAALIRTDGLSFVETGPFLTIPYTPETRSRIRATFGGKGDMAAVSEEITRLHAAAGKALLTKAPQDWADVASLAGFHGQTVHHDPANGITIQLGDGALLASLLELPVVNDFRTQDVQAGGEGAPLAPLYHQALASSLPKPLVVLNIGGVSNYTWMSEKDIHAGDPGPGNALMDDWMLRHTGRAHDEGGQLALKGQADAALVESWLQHPYFARPFPKSADREAFRIGLNMNKGLEDGLATLALFTVRAIAHSLATMPAQPKQILVTGGGRHNQAVMQLLAGETKCTVLPVEQAGWQGDALEAQAFAYLAMRSLLKLPLSLPTTTGVPAPQTGGQHHLPV